MSDPKAQAIPGFASPAMDAGLNALTHPNVAQLLDNPGKLGFKQATASLRHLEGGVSHALGKAQSLGILGIGSVPAAFTSRFGLFTK